MCDFNYNYNAQGWECPKCHRIYSPTTSQCLYCNDIRVITTTTTNIDTNDDSNWWNKYNQKTSSDNGVKIGKDGSIMWNRPTPNIYLENMSWRDWLDFNSNVWED